MRVREFLYLCSGLIVVISKAIIVLTLLAVRENSEVFFELFCTLRTFCYICTANTQTMATKEEKAGYVYILTNPSFREDWVKIGMAQNVEERLKTLDTTALPLPFKKYATMKTVKYQKAEKLVHHYIGRFTDLRIRSTREFFNVTPQEALEIFCEVAELIDDAVVKRYDEDGKPETIYPTIYPVQNVETLPQTRQRKNFEFSMIGLQKNDVITFSPTGAEVKIESEKHISFKGKNYTLTGFCKAFLPDDMRTNSGAYRGPKYFEYNGKPLVDIRSEREGKGFSNPETLVPQEGDRIMCIKVGKVLRENLYEMTRKHWKVRYERASQATHVLAVIGGIVQAVYIPQVWKRSTGSRAGRCEFEGVEDVNSKYIGKSVVAFYGKSQNPIGYINM